MRWHRSGEALRREAAAWVAQVHDSGAAIDRAAFERWRAAGPDHAQAYARAERAWQRSTLLHQTEFGRRRALPERKPWFRTPPARYGIMSVAVLLLAVIGLSIAGVPPFGGGPTPTALTLASRVGEIRTAALPDGSRVTLDTDSAVETAFTRDARRLRVTRGRARFEVAHDAGRPFVVAAGTGSVTATGTVFDVSVVGPMVRVALLRGTVEVRGDAVARAPGSSIRLARLTAGQQVSFGAALALSAPRPVRSADDAWTRGMLLFDRTPLADAITEANRYSGAKLALADPALADLRVTGAYRAGDAPGLARSLAFSLGLRAVPTPHHDIMLVARTGAP